MPSAVAVLEPSYMRLKELFRPVRGVYPTTKWSVDQYSASAQSYVSVSGVSASTSFNVQGQQWQASGLGAGYKNTPTPRQVFGNYFAHVQEFEFEFSDDKFDLMLVAAGDYNTQIYVTEEGHTYRLRDKPLGEVGASSYRFRQVLFTDKRPRAIRIVIGGAAYFVQINKESRAVLRPSKDRPFYIADGDSYFEGIHSYNAGSAESYYVYGNIDAIFEATGFVAARHAEGGTGIFNDSTIPPVVTTSDTPGPNAASRWGSAQRVAAASADLAAKPLFWLFNGTINDGLAPSKAATKARMFEIYQAINAYDPGIGFIHVGPEPYNNGYAAGSVHDLNRQAMLEANTQHGNGLGYIDPMLDPQGPWYTGLGYENSVTTSQQAQLTGGDQIHGNFHGYDYYGRMIAKHLGEIGVPRSRAEKYL